MSAAVAVVVLAYGDEPHLGACLRAVLAAADTAPADDGGFEVVVVDNGAAPESVAGIPDDPRLHVVTPGENTGFAGGCHVGVDATTAPVLLFVNSDVTVAPDAFAPVREALTDPGTGIVCGALRLADRPDDLNAFGVDLGYVGLGWAARLGAPAADFPDDEDVTCATGGYFGIRRATWDDLGGFDTSYFAYHEDIDLSLRCLLRGLRVRCLPRAVAWHAYEFGRHPRKMYLLERNRWQTLLVDYPRPVLVRVLPAVVLFDLALFAVAVQQGWWRQKASAWRWVLQHRRDIAARRRRVQADTTMSAADFAARLRPDVAAPVLGESAALRVLNTGLRAYWALARRGLR